jgi:hypothetical protein
MNLIVFRATMVIAAMRADDHPMRQHKLVKREKKAIL